MKRAMVTGASGFVGANLVRRLLRDGHEVHLLLRRSHQPWRLREIAADVRVHETDMQDGDSAAAAVREVRPDWVFHLAAYGAYSNQTGMAQMVATNLMGCIALLDACVQTGVEAFVQTGSSSEYGYKDHPPGEDETLEPNSHYAISKAAATHYCKFTARKADINAVTARLYSIYGPYEEPTRLIPTLIIYGFRGIMPHLVSPRIARDFVYVEDAVDALVQIASSRSLPRGAVYNVCSGRQSNLEEVVAVARRLLGITANPVWSSMPERSWDTDRWAGAAERIQREVGWQSRTELPDGLEHTINWFNQQPVWRRFYAERLFPGESA
jgi:nucleoside-diphosphate-sugar epimerase